MKAPKLRDINGRAYNPRKALRLFEELATGNTELLNDKILMTTLRWGLVRNYPLEPTFHKGRSGKKYDHYTCGNCGFGVTEAFIKYCENCGQRLTDAYAGRRKTQEEQEQYWEE